MHCELRFAVQKHTIYEHFRGTPSFEPFIPSSIHPSTLKILSKPLKRGIFFTLISTIGSLFVVTITKRIIILFLTVQYKMELQGSFGQIRHSLVSCFAPVLHPVKLIL